MNFSTSFYNFNFCIFETYVIIIFLYIYSIWAVTVVSTLRTQRGFMMLKS